MIGKRGKRKIYNHTALLSDVKHYEIQIISLQTVELFLYVNQIETRERQPAFLWKHRGFKKVFQAFLFILTVKTAEFSWLNLLFNNLHRGEKLL